MFSWNVIRSTTSLYLKLFSLIVDMMVVDDIFNMFQILANAKFIASIYASYKMNNVYTLFEYFGKILF